MQRRNKINLLKIVIPYVKRVMRGICKEGDEGFMDVWNKTLNSNSLEIVAFQRKAGSLPFLSPT